MVAVLRGTESMRTLAGSADAGKGGAAGPWARPAAVAAWAVALVLFLIGVAPAGRWLGLRVIEVSPTLSPPTYYNKPLRNLTSECNRSASYFTSSH